MQIVKIQMRDLMKRVASMGITIDLSKKATEFLPKRVRPCLRRATAPPRPSEGGGRPDRRGVIEGKYPEGTKIRVNVNKKTGELRSAHMARR